MIVDRRCSPSDFVVVRVGLEVPNRIQRSPRECEGRGEGHGDPLVHDGLWYLRCTTWLAIEGNCDVLCALRTERGT